MKNCRECGNQLDPEAATASRLALYGMALTLRLSDAITWAHERGPLCKLCIDMVRNAELSKNKLRC